MALTQLDVDNAVARAIRAYEVERGTNLRNLKFLLSLSQSYIHIVFIVKSLAKSTPAPKRTGSDIAQAVAEQANRGIVGR